MKALAIYAGPKAREHLQRYGFLPQHVGVIPGAAGGPKGLILGPLDRFIFGQWLPQSHQFVDLVGASIGAWRMATACLNDSAHALVRLEKDYIAQHYELAPGQRKPSAHQVSQAFVENLNLFYGDRIQEVLSHPRYRLHILTSHGKGLLHRAHALRTPLGYACAFAANAMHRPWMGRYLERVVFSGLKGVQKSPHPLPFSAQDYPTQQIALTEGNFMAALQASCSIPFVLEAVHDISGAPRGAYWDGGITDYHLHLNWQNHTDGPTDESQRALVLYPHFQKSVIPGWLDKTLKWRHGASSFLDHTVVLAPKPQWVQTLPQNKLPDRQDFVTYADDFPGRVRVWQSAVQASQQLADEFAQWLEKPDLSEIQSL